MLRFRHYKPSKWGDEPMFGIVLDASWRQPTLDIYFGRHVFVVFYQRGWK